MSTVHGIRKPTCWVCDYYYNEGWMEDVHRNSPVDPDTGRCEEHRYADPLPTCDKCGDEVRDYKDPNRPRPPWHCDKPECQPIEEGKYIRRSHDTAFDRAFILLKIDEGMWDEIYAPLFEIGTGPRGSATDLSPRNAVLDFMLPKDLPQTRQPYSGFHDDSYSRSRIEELMESILEHGYLGQESDWWDWGEGAVDAAQRYERAKIGGPGNVSIPQIEFKNRGWVIGEGNHRLAALRELGAPYIPAYARQGSPNYGNYYDDPGTATKPQYSVDLPMGEDMLRWSGIGRGQEEHGKAYSGYGIGASVGRRGMHIPPSFLFEQELVPGMGRLVPDLPDDLTAADMPLGETRTGSGWWGEGNDPDSHFREWQNRPKWKVVHDD